MQEETTSKTTNNEEITNSPQIENKEDVVSQKKSFWEVIKKILRALNPKNIFLGRIISVDFIIRYWKTILTILFIMLFYISNRYTCQQSVAKITMLHREVEEIGYISLDMYTLLKNQQREDSIIKKIEQFNLDLKFPVQPPYVVKEDNNGKE